MNVRRVFAIAAALVALACIWMADTEWSGRRQLAAAAQVPDAIAKPKPAPSALPTADRLLALSAAATTTGNVFGAATIDQFIERRETQRKADEAARLKAEQEAEARRQAAAAEAAAKAAAEAAAKMAAEAAAKVAAEAAAKVAAEAAARAAGAAAPAVKEPPPKRVYAITYSGVVTTPDQQNVGIIGIVLSDSPEKRISMAVAPGDACLDAVVTGFTGTNLTIQLKEGKAVVLDAGKTQRFEEPLLNGP